MVVIRVPTYVRSPGPIAAPSATNWLYSMQLLSHFLFVGPNIIISNMTV